MRKSIIIFTLLFLRLIINAQFTFFTTDTNYFSFRNSMENMFGSILPTDSTLQEEGSIYSAYQRFNYFWAPRLGGINDSGTSERIFKTIKL